MEPVAQSIGGKSRLPPEGPFTWDDFVALPDDDRRELIDGALIEVEVPNYDHEYIVAMIAYFLTAWARPRKAGDTLLSGYKIRVSDRQGVMPDVQFFRAGHTVRKQPQGLTEGHPDLAVEVISQSSIRYDRVTKLGWYARIAVPEYWIVSPEQRTVERLLLRDGQYVFSGSAADEEVFVPDTFPGLEIPLAELWSTNGAGTDAPGERRVKNSA
jgi:Uma2 family endonuclease